MKSLVWVKKCLRLHDNPSLQAAIEGAEKVFVVYIIDPKVTSKMSPNRLQFLYECLADLDNSLREKCSSALMVFHGNPLEILSSIIIRYGIFRLYGDKDLEEYGESLEIGLKPILAALGVHTKFYHSNSLYDLERLLQIFGDTPPLNFANFCLQVEEHGLPPAPLPVPGKFPRPSDSELSGTELPSPVDFGIAPDDLVNTERPVKGGETQGLEQLAKTIGSAEWVEKFENERTDPTSITPSTSLMSPYLAFGAVSPKRYYIDLHSTYLQTKRKPQDFSATLFSQIFWREFFLLLSFAYPNFGKIEGNPLCRRIEWEENNALKEKFVEGKTGFPWIDACVNQMKRCGWIHHLARHSLACFLTRGDLWLSWEIGRDIFEKYMIDYDWSLCNGNWIWKSGSGFEGQLVLVYNPSVFPKEYDPEGNFIRHFVPILKNFPKEYIFEPSKAPLEVQQQAGCIIGKDHPMPMVDHEAAVKTNTQKLHASHLRLKNLPFPLGGTKVRESVAVQTANNLESLKRKREEAEKWVANQSDIANRLLTSSPRRPLLAGIPKHPDSKRILISSLLNDIEEPVQTTQLRQQEKQPDVTVKKENP